MNHPPSLFQGTMKTRARVTCDQYAYSVCGATRSEGKSHKTLKQDPSSHLDSNKSNVVGEDCQAGSGLYDIPGLS